MQIQIGLNITYNERALLADCLHGTDRLGKLITRAELSKLCEAYLRSLLAAYKRERTLADDQSESVL